METEIVSLNTTNETLEAIYQRRAIRKYNDRSVSDELIEAIISAGRMAPSALNRQAWHFYVVKNRTIIRTLSEEISKKAFSGIRRPESRGGVRHLTSLLQFAGMFRRFLWQDPVFYGAPVVIFITSPREDVWGPIDVGMCVQNMLLAAYSLGLSTCPIGFGRFVEQTEHYPLLGIPKSEIVQLSVIIGYSDDRPPVHKRITDNVRYIN